MNQLNRNFDMVAMLVLVLLLGVVQARPVPADRMLRVARVMDTTQERVISRIQERMQRCARTPQVKRLVYSR